MLFASTTNRFQVYQFLGWLFHGFHRFCNSRCRSHLQNHCLWTFVAFWKTYLENQQTPLVQSNLRLNFILFRHITVAMLTKPPVKSGFLKLLQYFFNLKIYTLSRLLVQFLGFFVKLVSNIMKSKSLNKETRSRQFYKLSEKESLTNIIWQNFQNNMSNLETKNSSSSFINPNSCVFAHQLLVIEQQQN